MTANGISISPRFVWGASMNGRAAFNPPRGDRDDAARVEAGGIVDAQNASTNSLENATRAFPTAPTRQVLDMIQIKKSVTHVAGQICYLGRRPDNLESVIAGFTDQGCVD